MFCCIISYGLLQHIETSVVVYDGELEVWLSVSALDDLFLQKFLLSKPV